MKQRLQKVIAQSGLTSRRKAEELIAAGKVKVNGQKVTEMGFLVGPEDAIMVNGKPLGIENKVYLVINKPKQVISAVSDDRDRKVVTDLIKIPERVYPVGRLDYDTTGLLILTNDGDFANQLIHPRYHLPKTYYVKIKGKLSPEAIKKLSLGLKTKHETYQKALVSDVRTDYRKNTTHFDLTIYEGKNRQIRLMMEFLGYDVMALSRMSIGPLSLGNLRSGQYRTLTIHEIKLLRQASEKGMVNEKDR